MAVIGVATLFDIYFDTNHVEFVEIETSSSEEGQEQNTLLLISQSTNPGVKTLEQKKTDRKVQVKSHDKLIQKNYQLRNYQVLKAELQTQTAPLINSYHYLAYKNYFFSDPDGDPVS
jgi:hypothetical protein